MIKPSNSADNLITQILLGIDQVKGVEVNLLDLRNIENTVCDYFIVCSGTSNTHVSAIVGSVHKDGKQSHSTKNHFHTEGLDNSENGF